MRSKLKSLAPLLGIVPFLIGTVGYLLEGVNLMDSMYWSMSLYAGNQVQGEYNYLIEIARWAAPFTTATVLLCAVKRWGNMARCFFRSLSSKSIAVYCDTDVKLRFEGRPHKDIYPGRNLVKSAKEHIIMLQSDTDSLEFYEKNMERLKKRKVYIALREIEYGLAKNRAVDSIIFYDVNGSIARMLWKEIKLWENVDYGRKVSVSILGDGHLGQAVLSYGLLLNLYSLEQRISYYLIGDANIYENVHGNMDLCNQDNIRYYDSHSENITGVISSSDYIIITKQISAEQLQAVGVLGMDKQVYYYSPNEGDAGEYLELPNLKHFGRQTDVFTYENVCEERIMQRAKEINFYYARKYNEGCGTVKEKGEETKKEVRKKKEDEEKEWQKLNGFLKWSNISAADHGEVIERIIELRGYGKDEKFELALKGYGSADGSKLEFKGYGNDERLEELAELEHIRWCRFHYLNHWRYGIPSNGKFKDEKNRIHTCLCRYSELDEKDKDKDRDVIKQIYENKYMASWR